jgi:hypothetical protein
LLKPYRANGSIRDQSSCAFFLAVLDAAPDELLALRHHDLALLLADRLAQEVGLGQRVARDDLRDAHDLFLVDEDPERLGKDRLELRQRVGHAAGAAAPAHVVLDRARVERARPVERVESREVGEDARLGPAQEVPHTARIELEDAGGLAGAEELVGRLVVQGDVVEVQRDAEPLPDRGHRRLQDVERDEPQEVDLEQAHLLDRVHVELGRDFVLVGAVERQELDDGARRDDHAGGVHPGVAGEPLEALGDLDHPRDGLVRGHRLLEARRVAEGPLEGDVRPVRHELRDAVADRDRQRENARHVPDRELGLELRERHDLGHALAPVLARYVVDDLRAPRLAEIDVDVGHRDPLWVQEALEQEVETQRIDLRDPQRPRDDGSGRAAPSGTDRDALLPRLADEVGDDQEVRRESHLLDDPDLVLEALAILLGRNRVARGAGRDLLLESPLQALSRQVTEVVGRGAPVRRRERRQVEAIRVEGHRAALRDRGGVGHGLGAPRGEARLHLVRILDVELVVVEPHPALVLKRLAHADAEQDLVRERVVAAQVVAVVGRHRGGAGLRGQPQEVRNDRGLLGKAVVHQLDVEIALAEDRLVLEERPLGRGEVSARQGAGYLPLEAPGQADEPLRMLGQEGLVHARAVIEARQIGLGDQPDQVSVALLGRGQDRQVVRVPLSRLARGLELAIAAVGRSDVRLDADDGPHSVLERLVEEVKRAEHVAVVGDRDRGHAELGDPAAELGQPVGAVQERVLAVEMKVDEVAGHRLRWYTNEAM